MNTLRDAMKQAAELARPDAGQLSALAELERMREHAETALQPGKPLWLSEVEFRGYIHDAYRQGLADGIGLCSDRVSEVAQEVQS